jgi:hypothetical protein
LDFLDIQSQEIANIMNDKMSKASICSIVSLDIIDYSVKSETEKLALKTYFDSIVNQAVADIPTQDRTIVDAVNGVAIACNGPLEDALEDALFISLTVRDEILKHNTQSTTPLYVQIGINLGPVIVVNDLAGKQSLIGDGLEDAQRVMCFANPNQILVTYDYYEKASQLTHEISQMFDKYDVHTLEHDVYAVRLLKEASLEDEPSIPADISDLKPSVASKINWQYVGSVMFGLLVFFVITKVGLEPTEPNIILDEPMVAETPTLPKTEMVLDAPSSNTDSEVSQQITTEIAETAPNEPTQNAVAEQLDDIKVADIAKSAEGSNKDLASNQNSTVKTSKVKNKVAQKTDSPSKLSSRDGEKTQVTISTKNSDTASNNKATSTAKEHEVDVAVSTKQAELKTEKMPTKEKSAWESFKAGIAKGAERNCTQAEIAMNQCIKI